MEEKEKIGLESASVFVLGSGDPISPATITFITVPDFDYTGSGSVSLGGSAHHRVSVSKQIESSWSILGTFNSGFSSEWRIGEGEYYWYRVEGSCGESRCDTTGVSYDTCRRMTFTTVVGARNLAELCEKLSDPIANPKVNFRISSIKKYSRPVERSSSDDCNSLDEQEFCNVAECLDYCIDQDVVQNFSFSMRAIESSFFAEMRGGLNLSGRILTDRNRTYEPEFPVIGFSGSAQSKVSIPALVGLGSVAILGESEIISDHYSFEGLDGPIAFGGFARVISPSRKYSDMEGLLLLGGSALFSYSPNPYGGLELGGSAINRTTIRFVPSGKVEMGGRLLDYTSPTFFNSGSGGLVASGGALLNFVDFGLARQSFGFSMSAFDFGSESFVPDYSSGLTISDQTISPSCGCGPLSLSLTVRHNMSNSSYLSSFLKRSGLSMADSHVLRYRSSDSSWRFSQNFSGKGRDGSSSEDISIFYSMSCSEGFWKFSFSAVNVNRSIGKELHTKFILDIPADLVCSDGSISTNLELEIQNGGFQEGTNINFAAVTPPNFIGRTTRPRIVDVYVDGVFNDERIYYDDIGLFKNSYWNSSRLEFNINMPVGAKMPELEIYRIFT